MVQEPLNPAVLEAARQLLDRTKLRWTEALQLGAALVAREMFRGTEIIFVSASPALMETARAEGFQALDPEKDEMESSERTACRPADLLQDFDRFHFHSATRRQIAGKRRDQKKYDGAKINVAGSREPVL